MKKFFKLLVVLFIFVFVLNIKIKAADEVSSPNTPTENEVTENVSVPNTLSSRSALLMAISMFDIALGIGIINYVKKNQIQE